MGGDFNHAGLGVLVKRLLGLRELKRFRFALFLSCLVLLASTLSGLGAGLLTGRFTDSALGGNVDFAFFRLMAGAVGAALVFGAINQWYWGHIQCNIAFELRKKTVEKINRLRYSWIETQSSGDTVVRLNTDLEQFIGFYGQFRSIFVSFFTGFLSLGLIIYIHPLLALGYLLFPAICQWYIYAMSRANDPLFRKRQELFGQAAAVSQEFLNHPLEIKAMNMEKYFAARYRDALRKFTGHVVFLDRKACKTDALLETLGLLQNIALLILGGYMVFGGKLSLGELLTAQLAAGNINNAVKSLNFFQLRLNMPAAWRVFEIWDTGETPEARQITGGGHDAIVFDHVTFAYPGRPETKVLRDVNFSIRRGMKAAIVGPNGSGKSSVVKLLAGLYVPDEGAVSVFSKNIAFIEQDTFLFSGTFARNIACGEFSADDAVIDSAKKALIHDFIVSTGEGYAGDCAAGGGLLSGGQRQRVSIARALYRNADIILLDEPTSSLEKEAGAELVKTFIKVFSGRTLIMITHSLDLVQDFDCIYLMKNGELVKSGTHRELLGDERYRTLLQEGRHE
ncbi:MAG: ABC transporter ATP-binding protein/permease [Spirochaetaceae bacterium]|jgi:ABC-type multidrug transport system fused ATPase/permease subunit|nr:ABC transporter ATP-binding protein/permease [Spirochaetaceae bacterium]